MSGKSWKVASLVVDNYIQNRNKRIELQNPTIDAITLAIDRLDGAGRSSLAIMGNDDSVVLPFPVQRFRAAQNEI